jgi:hypothetical protein
MAGDGFVVGAKTAEVQDHHDGLLLTLHCGNGLANNQPQRHKRRDPHPTRPMVDDEPTTTTSTPADDGPAPPADDDDYNNTAAS